MSDDAPGHAMDTGSWPSIGRLALPLVGRLVEDAHMLRLEVSRSPAGATIVDAGIAVSGCLEAGRRIAEICLGGVGTVSIAGGDMETAPFEVCVRSPSPVLACLASQYAGWSLEHGKGDDAYFAMASGPGRARAAKEEIFSEIGYRDAAGTACFVLETDRPPPVGLIEQVARDCGLPASALTFVLTPTSSLAGTVQIVSRVLEVALHKCHVLGFPLEHVVDGMGRAPLPPPSPHFVTAMGRTNDAVLFGGEVQLFVSGPEAEAERLAASLPSSASSDYGRPFAEIFEEVEADFYKIDPMLFSPARVLVTALQTGRTFAQGGRSPVLLARSFGFPQ
ncbi:methenyltetrahydromethanopterin cyclohydrolase [Marinimicrococcus flavescens]|uniref:Methenyltetrahydromethanopterin cyclohydrolase n=1 Tax=Marinimicrococcus flavescens TaxID=3031815 RepID=A0AAP3XQA8_9PROT|nr:methenyltetrahydromethanopterin cyclohydrolase [Marinimicrococcus flavescens]